METKSDIQSLCARLQSVLAISNEVQLAHLREKCISTVRAVYDAAQIIGKNSGSSEASEELHGLISLLFHVVTAGQLPFDASVLASSSIVLLLSHIHPGNTDIYFKHFYFKIAGNHGCDTQFSSCLQTVDETVCSSCCHMPVQVKSTGIQSLLALLHGFLKTSPEWMFKNESAIHIFDIIPLLVNLVDLVDVTWLYQLFLALELWSAKVKEKLASMLSVSEGKQTSSDAIEFLLSVCSLHQNKPGSLFTVVSTHWECPVKGVPGLCIGILSNMVSIFDGVTSVSPLSPGTNIVLNNVLSSALWSSRASYASLQSLLLGHHLTAQELVQRCGRELCSGMCGGLCSSHLATCVTALYRLIVVAISEELWLLNFFEGFVAALTSHNKTTQHNLVTLWLPVTLQRHPGLWRRLIAACPDSDSGWLAKLAVLKSASSAVSPHMLCLGTESCTAACESAEKLDLHAPNVNEIESKFESLHCDPSSPRPKSASCPAATLVQALDHPVPAVRADALALLCTQAKGSSISEEQGVLIQDFFVLNINIDCSIFRLSVIKSFKHLMARLRETLCKLTKPFKRELESDKKISRDKIVHDLMVSSKLVVWFVRFLHHELNSDGNYQRKITCLQLYRALILSFSSSASKSKKLHEIIAIELAMKFIALHSTEKEWCVEERMFWATSRLNKASCGNNLTNDDSGNYSPSTRRSNAVRSGHYYDSPITDLTLPYTIPLIFSYLSHEMNDVRDESEELLSLFSEKSWLLYVQQAHFSTSNPETNIHTFKNQDLFENLDFSYTVIGAPSGDPSGLGTKQEPTEKSELKPGVIEAHSASQPQHDRGCVAFSQLLRDALSLLDCPKMSVAESGAITVRVVVAATLRAGAVSLDQVLRRVFPSNTTLTTFSSDTEDPCLCLLKMLLAKARHDLAQARRNLLRAASSAPIYGALLALASVLGSSHATNVSNVGYSTSNDSSHNSNSIRAYEEFLPQVLVFCEEAVNHMLGCMALAAREGSAVAPSFSEMSESIERIILRCQETSLRPEESGSCSAEVSNAHYIDAENVEFGAISSSHQLVLSCCWQTIRAACMLCSTVVCSPLVHTTTASTSEAAATSASASGILPTSPACDVGSDAGNSAPASGILPASPAGDVDERALVCLSTRVVTRAVEAVLIRTLTGTRHKGAIEAAKVCLGDVCVVMLRRPQTCNIVATLVDATLRRELNLPADDTGTSRRSVTRRAAGLAMLVQAACVADDAVCGRQRQPRLLLSTIDTLLQHASHQTLESELEDCRCSVVLHLLQGLLQQVQRCLRLGDIAAACLAAFSSSCWRCRNAGLQLFGGLVSRLVGQKKVSQDSSEYNSITAPQFISANPELANSILQLLSCAARAADKDNDFSIHDLNSKCLIKPSGASELCSDGQERSVVLESDIEQIPAGNKCNGSLDEVVPENRSEFGGVSPADAAFRADLRGRSEVELSSAVLPVLCLLSRLSPGLHLSVDNYNHITIGFQECLCKLLASSIINIRSLAAVSLLSLTPQAQQKSLISRILDRLSSGTSFLLENSTKTKPLNNLQKDNFVTTNERHGLLLVVKAYIERGIHSAENLDRNQLRRALVAVYSNESECYVIRALACECLLLINDQTSLSIDKCPLTRDLTPDPGFGRFVEVSFMYLLRSEGLQQLLSYVTKGSYFVAQIVSNFWIENISQRKITSLDGNERAIVRTLVHLVLSNEQSEKSDLLLKIIEAYFEVEERGHDLLAGMKCTAVVSENLRLILKGKLHASTQRSLLILISHLLHSGNVALPDDVLHLFCESVVKFSRENSSEEFRLCSSKCIGVLLPCLLAGSDVHALRCLKENVVEVVCSLLCDEDPCVRHTAASHLFLALSSTQKHSLHANKMLVVLLSHFGELCRLKNDAILLESLWKCYVDCAQKHACSKARTNNGFRSYLFESDALNLYKENGVITQMLKQTLLTAAQNPCCAQTLQKLCSSYNLRESSSSPQNVLEALPHSRLKQFHDEVLFLIENSTVQT